MKHKGDELLKTWYNKAEQMEFLHREAFQYYYKKDAAITIPSIIITSIAACISFLSIGLYTRNIYFGLISGTLNIISTIMASTKQYFNWNHKSYQHNNSSVAYLKIKNLIEIQLSLHKLGLNMPYEKMIPEIGSIITKVDNESPPLPSHISCKISPSHTMTIELIDEGTDSDTKSKVFYNNQDSENNTDNNSINIIDEYNNIKINEIMIDP